MQIEGYKLLKDLTAKRTLIAGKELATIRVVCRQSINPCEMRPLCFKKRKYGNGNGNGCSALSKEIKIKF